ncbi:MAG: hypothetical protein WBP81_24945 [Solirubrobacteraceae bacterium]
MSTLRFHERMSGWISFEQHSYNQAVAAGRRSHNACSQELEIEIDDLDRFLCEPDHAARAEGIVHCDQLGGGLAVQPGSSFNLFVDAGGARHKRMLYRLYLVDTAGRELTLSGFKDLEDDPNLDVWGDTSRLLIRILSGRVDREPIGDESSVATGILYISRFGFLRMLSTFRGSGAIATARATARFNEFFVHELGKVYGGPAVSTSAEDFPSPTELDARWQGKAPERWHDLEGHSGLRRRIIGFHAQDAARTALTLHQIRGEADPTLGPVLLIHGGGVRANLFYDAPRRPTIVDVLVGHGYDVWLENWRASIDLPPRSYTLDQGAVYDHPAAVAEIKRQTGAETMKAIVQCQGSTSLTMSAIAGLVPEITTIVSNAVSLYVNVPKASELKLQAFVPVCETSLSGLDAQWAVRAPSALATGFARVAHLIRGRDCDNEVCQVANYMYGVGRDILWRHANLDGDTHDWVSREFGYCPFSLLAQIGRAQRKGYLVPVDGLAQLPESLVDVEPMTDARFAFLAGSRNRLFLPLSQRRSFEHFEHFRRDYHTFHELPGYTHLDVMFGRNAHHDVFPLILRELAAGR